MKYTLGRVLLFALAALALLPFRMNLLLTLMIALVASMVLSYFLLRRWRNEFAEQIADGARKRREQKEQLRAALAGEDAPPTPPPGEDKQPSPPPDTPSAGREA